MRVFIQRSSAWGRHVAKIFRRAISLHLLPLPFAFPSLLFVSAESAPIPFIPLEVGPIGVTFEGYDGASILVLLLPSAFDQCPQTSERNENWYPHFCNKAVPLVAPERQLGSLGAL